MPRPVKCFFVFCAVLFGVVQIRPAPAGAVPADAQLRPLNLEFAWRSQAILDPRRDTVAHLTNDEEIVYVQSTSGTVTAFNAEDGRQLWARQVGRSDAVSMRAESNEDVVVIPTGPEAWGLNKFSGDVLFRYRMRVPASAGPALGPAAVYFPVMDGSLRGFALQTLIHLERYDTLPPGVSQPWLWHFNLNERIEYPPVTTEDVIAFTTKNRSLFSISTAGRTVYQQFLRAEVTAPPVLDLHDDRFAILVATSDRNLYSFDLKNGTLLWYVPLERNIEQAPLVLHNRVYFVMRATGMAAVSTVSGKYLETADAAGGVRRWLLRGVRSMVGAGVDRVYAIDSNRRLIAVDAETADVQGAVDLGDFTMSIANAITDRLYVCSPSGDVLCLKPRGTRFATFLQNPAREPLEVDVPATDEEADRDEDPDDGPLDE